MTNEEKAREIVQNWIEDNSVDGYYVVSEEDFIDGCNGMAQWKDSQLSEELNIISDWFKHIAQIADDKKTLNGFIMKDSDAFDEIKCLAKSSAEYIDMRLLCK